MKQRMLKKQKMIKAEIIADSLNEFGQRLTTFVLVFPRIVLAEFNTHRMLSKNSASSRAIPFEKMLKRVMEDPFIPIRWMKEHKGMQGTEYFEECDRRFIEPDWLRARNDAVSWAKSLNELGVTKQIVNRLLEPFMWHTVIVTGTEWENFFALRAHEAAEIHIQELAYQMLEQYNGSHPKQLKAGEWHIPFGDTFDKDRLYTMIEAHHGVFDPIISYKESKGDFSENPLIEKYKVMISTARCARVSYLNFEGKDDYEADIKLHDMLLKSGHMSPFEHCARAMDFIEHSQWRSGHLVAAPDEARNASAGWCGNFRGFIQYRKTLPNENKRDTRVLPREK